MARSVMLGCALVLAIAGPAATQSKSNHVIVDPASTKWGPGPAALPPGARAVLLYGDPAKPEFFVMRLSFPKGFRIPPHTHPQPEILTIISGSFRLGMGRTADRAKARRLGPGSFTAMPPDMAHYAFIDQPSVVQISTTGPWAVKYINPADDPRNKRK